MISTAPGEEAKAAAVANHSNIIRAISKLPIMISGKMVRPLASTEVYRQLCPITKWPRDALFFNAFCNS